MADGGELPDYGDYENLDHADDIGHDRKRERVELVRMLTTNTPGWSERSEEARRRRN